MLKLWCKCTSVRLDLSRKIEGGHNASQSVKHLS